ncbi:SUMO-activating enzyme subunit 1 isoform X1 [Daphnia magna]|uniref:SUMO-activating enzyme subunit 1 isoform X1 n=1 Tax=Daphnia magna TaxID=35525 RepID=UPI001E1BBF8D|nr:SUMO-activating enzyme subunit 1 isoform X1 [Daphnia magna]
MVAKEEVTISEAEAALYDRQIRLWGLEAQKRLRAARVLLIGLGGLGAEIAKNLTLSGIKSLTLLDHSIAVANSANFLIPLENVGKNVVEASLERVQRLNPMVDILTDTENVTAKNEDFFSGFDVVCATRLPVEESIRINAICRKHSIPFYSGDVFGFGGFFFVDLLEHEYSEEVNVPAATLKDGCTAKKNDPSETKTVKHTLNYIPLQAAFEADPSSQLNKRSWQRIKSHFITMKSTDLGSTTVAFVSLALASLYVDLTTGLLMFRSQMKRDPEAANRQSDIAKLCEIRDHILHEMKLDNQMVDSGIFETVFGELSPAAAVVGGVLAQEIIKAVSHKDAPIRNHFFFNGATDFSGVVEAIGF